MSKKTALITGFPKTELARWVLRTWLGRSPEHRAVCIVPAQFATDADRAIEELAAKQASRVRLFEGDAAHMDLGLSGPKYTQLAAEVHTIHHCAAMDYSGVDVQRATRFNENAAREAVELALAAKQLERLVHWSSTRAIGSLDGRVREDSLAEPDRGPVADSRHRAERIVREVQDRVPLTVLRTPYLVGDSETGYWPRMESVYLIARTLLISSRDVVLPVPARREAVLNLVPVDYAAQAGVLLASDPETVGRTFHIVDPSPLTVGEVFRLFAQLTGRPEPSQGMPVPLAEAILRAPGIAKMAHGPRELLEELGRNARLDDRNARTRLEAAGLACPPLADYAPRIVDFIRTLPADSTWPDPLRSQPPAAPVDEGAPTEA